MAEVHLPPVVLLHGCGGSPEQAFEQAGWVEAFRAAGRQVHALHLPGHGRDGPSHDPADYADMAQALLPQFPAGACDIVGFSLGAKLALDIAVRWPHRVRRMVLGGIGDNAFAPETVGEAAAAALEHGAGPDTPPGVRAFLATWEPSLNDPLAVAAVLRRPANPVLDEGMVAAITTPVAVINGADDFVMTLGSRLFSALDIQPHVLPGVGHFDLTAQTEFQQIAARFLGEEGYQ
ncbi:MAG: alpha/beta fold hydrolase [Alteraurantiacibacter sp.]